MCFLSEISVAQDPNWLSVSPGFLSCTAAYLTFPMRRHIPSLGPKKSLMT